MLAGNEQKFLLRSKSYSALKFISKRLLLLIFGLSFILGSIWYLKPRILPSEFISEGVLGTYTEENLPSQVASLISTSLITVDKSGLAQPNLVSGWQVNSDATSYTFKLKDDLVWNDGTPVKSSDLEFNLPDVQISFPDDKTIHFQLTDSFSPFPTLLANPVLKKDTLMGIGKFKIVEKYTNNTVITKLVLKSVNQDLPKIIVRFYPDEKIAKTAFAIGEIDSLIGPLSAEEFASYRTGLKKINTYNKVTAIFYNTKDPILSDKNFRLALSYAALKGDNDVSSLLSSEERAKTSIPRQSWAYNDDVRKFLDNGGNVKSYLEKVKNGKESSITVTTGPALAKLAESIVMSWKKEGINAVVRIEGGSPQDFQVLLTSQPIPVDPDQYALWHSTQAKTNLSKYSSPRIDKDLEDGRRVTDQNTRRDKYNDFQKVLLDDSPATFLYFPRTNIIYRKKVESQIDKILNIQFPNV